jgi:glycine cleavage system aminomethyltransferase T
MEQGLKLWDTLWEAGQPHGGPRRHRRLRHDRPPGEGLPADRRRARIRVQPVEADLARPKVKEADFIGKEAYLKAREEGPAAILCTLTVDDHTSASGVKRYMLGREPILTADGEPIVDAHGRRSYVTSAGAGPVGRQALLMAYLPPDYAVEGHEAARRVHGPSSTR